MTTHKQSDLETLGYQQIMFRISLDNALKVEENLSQNHLNNLVQFITSLHKINSFIGRIDYTMESL